MNPQLPLIIIATLGLLFFLSERIIPLRHSTMRLVARLFVNVCLSAITFGIAIVTVRPAAAHLLNWTSEVPFGLLHMVSLPMPIKFVLSFLLLDLGFYYWHVANHRIPILWRFHNVHHLDTALDVSTGFRFHFGEVIISVVLRVVQISIIGPSIAAFAAYELVFQGCVLFHHSNIRLPIRIERLLNLILVTPRMHGIHHSQIFGEANSNYGTVFPWWDRLHRTLGLNIPQAHIAIGIAGYSSPDDNSVVKSLLIPFLPQRDYWRTPDGETIHRRPEELQGKPTELAE